MTRIGTRTAGIRIGKMPAPGPVLARLAPVWHTPAETVNPLTLLVVISACDRVPKQSQLIGNHAGGIVAHRPSAPIGHINDLICILVLQ